MLDLTGTFVAGPTFQGVYGTPQLTYTVPVTPITAAASGGVPMSFYSNGFLSAGAGQAGGSGGLLSAITGGLETFLPALFGGGGVPSARTPPIVPTTTGGQPGGIMRRVGPVIAKTATQHPVLTAAGGAAATVGGAILGARTIRGHKVVQAPDGTHMLVRHHRRMNPCNIHALRRGLRRAAAFERIAKRVLHITSPRKHVHGFKMPHRRKK